MELTPPPAPKKKRHAGLSLERETELNEWFLRVFWPEYPRKDKKLGARLAWRKLNPDRATVEKIVIDIRKRMKGKHRFGNWQGVAMEHIPLPTTYLNNGYWEE